MDKWTRKIDRLDIYPGEVGSLQLVFYPLVTPLSDKYDLSGYPVRPPVFGRWGKWLCKNHSAHKSAEYRWLLFPRGYLVLQSLNLFSLTVSISWDVLKLGEQTLLTEYSMGI